MGVVLFLVLRVVFLVWARGRGENGGHDVKDENDLNDGNDNNDSGGVWVGWRVVGGLASNLQGARSARVESGDFRSSPNLARD